MRTTLRKPSVSLPRLRLGHITGGYTASCLWHFAQIASAEKCLYSATSYTRQPLCAIRKPAFHGKETVNSMMLLPSFNFIGGKERMKLLRNFHLTKVKQNFFLFLRRGPFLDLKTKRFIIMITLTLYYGG